jgi:uncharacterized membrane protein
MWSWFAFWLVLHVLAVIIAFGPTFAFGLIAVYGQKHPQFALASAEITEMIEKRMTYPLVVAVPLFGTGLIYTGHFDLWKSEWLLISIPLYMAIFAFSLFVQTPNSNRMIKLLNGMRGPGAEGASPPTGPPPELEALGKRLQFGGMAMGIGIVIILVLMIWRPGSCQGLC